MAHPRSESSRKSTQLLVLVNPGRTSRHYMLALARAADRLGMLGGSIELGPIWQRLQGPHAKVDRPKIIREIESLCRSRGITHVLSYAHNGVFDFGPFPDPLGRSEAPVGLFTALGLAHILLWTDHPNWAMGASALAPQASRTLAHPSLTHIVKSRAAADEIREILGWPDVRAMAMAEDTHRISPATNVAPRHDVVMIMGDASAPPDEILSLLDDEDPAPSDIMHAMAPRALRDARGAASAHGASDSMMDAVETAVRAWIECKIAAPDRALHALAQDLEDAHADALAWMKRDAQRWYAIIGALQTLTRWQRSFWPAWLGRRVDVGVYGSPAEPLGLVSPLGPVPGEHWAPYDKQSEVYAHGRVALNINASHDEEGLTHKPFQIGAAGACCVHHATRELEESFTPGDDILRFERGPELLGRIRELTHNVSSLDELAGAMRSRVKREHSWDARWPVMLMSPGSHQRELKLAPVVESAA